jgi:hypothetical protein
MTLITKREKGLTIANNHDLRNTKRHTEAAGLGHGEGNSKERREKDWESHWQGSKGDWEGYREEDCVGLEGLVVQSQPLHQAERREVPEGLR